MPFLKRPLIRSATADNATRHSRASGRHRCAKGLFQRCLPESPVMTTLADLKPVTDTGIAQGDVQICRAFEQRIIRTDVEIETRHAREPCWVCLRHQCLSLYRVPSLI